MKKHMLLLSLAGLTAFPVQACFSQTVDATRKITTPKESIGFSMGDDFHMANYVQLTAYWQQLAKESDRMKLVDIGPTAEGRRQYMAIISSPENIAKLDHYREISEKLARAESLTDEEAHKLSEEGKSVIWIDGGLHASETVGSQQLIETVYRLNAYSDPETMRLLHDDIVLCVLDNPDGMDLVANWYMREPVAEKRVLNGYSATPRLWAKYVGHDNNRDFYMNNMPETTNISRILFRTWYPQIMYNHHQSGPEGAVIFMPPFRDPFNYHYDPLITMKIQAVGTAMHERLIEEDKPGSGMRSAANYSTWYNGGLRTVTYFHNMTGLLTEIIGSPTPMQLPLVPSRQLASNDLPDPVPPQLWHYKQSIDYEQTNNWAVLDYASREREHLLYDTYRMGKNSIIKGNQDSWTVTPKRIVALEDAAAKDKPVAKGMYSSPFENVKAAPSELYKTVLHDPAMRDARGYILSADQPDFPTATKFVNALMKSGVEIEQATADFTVAGKSYPKGSYVVMANQAYRPHVLDMFEPQDHPNDFAYPGGPPNRPYDATGWTLAFQMGVSFDRQIEAFTGPFAKITTELAAPMPGTITGPAKPAGYLVSHSYNDAFTLTNRLLKANQKVYWLSKSPAGMKESSTGTLWLPYSAETAKILETATKTLGINATAVTAKPTGDAMLLHEEKIGLYDQYGGLMPSGWMRWLFEQFEFPYTVIYPQNLDAGDLKAKFDDIVFSDGAILTPGRDGLSGAGRDSQPEASTIPAEFRPWLGHITKEKTMPQLQKFVEDGGTILAVGSSTAIYEYFHLPLSSAETEIVKGKSANLSGEKFYIPGSLMRTQVNNENPVAYGMPAKVDVFFDRSPAFRLNPDASMKGVQTIAWYDGGDLLDSGWAWGQQYLNNTVAVAEAKMGKGQVLLYGPEVTFRGQPHSTFKFLFNGLMVGASTPVVLK
jgi:hypothetical protein